MKAQARAEAQAAAQAQVGEQVKKTLAAEAAAYTEKLTEAIIKERLKTEDETLMAQLYVSKEITHVRMMCLSDTSSVLLLSFLFSFSPVFLVKWMELKVSWEKRPTHMT